MNDEGKMISKNGKVLVKYRKNHDYEYWVHERKVKSMDAPVDDSERNEKNKFRKREAGDPDEKIPPNSICIYTDGASSGNPGPSGIGVILRCGEHEKEISRYIGFATSNIAELKAIKTGLEELKRADLPVRIFTDSQYSFGVLALGWKPRKNTELVESIQDLISGFKNLKIIKVKGHAGHPENERADYLATTAIKNRA